MSEKLPQKPGFYLWYQLDLHSLDVGSVQVMADHENHREYLRKNIAERLLKGEYPGAYLYQADDGTWLSMYPQESLPHKLYFDPVGIPCVDGWRHITLDWLMGKTDNPDEKLPMKSWSVEEIQRGDPWK